MDEEATERQQPSASAAIAPVAAEGRARGRRPPPVVDAEFKVVSPIWDVWRRCRESWWALGPYLAYCTALWALAALVGWIMDRARAG